MKLQTRRNFLKQAGYISSGMALFPILQLSDEKSFPFWYNRSLIAPVETASDFEVDAAIPLDRGQNINYPAITYVRHDELYISWTEHQNGKEKLYGCRYVETTKFGPVQQLSIDGTINSHSRVIAAPEGVYVFWVSGKMNNRQLLYRVISGETITQPVVISGEDGNVAYPAITYDVQNGFCIVWQNQVAGRYKISARYLKDEKLSTKILLSYPNKDAFHPDVIWGENGAWIAFEEYSPEENYQIKLVSLQCSSIEKEYQVTDHPAGNIFPSLSMDYDRRLWIAFQSARKGVNSWDIPRWVYLHLLVNNRIVQFSEPLSSQDLSKKSTDQCLEFPRLTSLLDGRMILLARPSHNFFIQFQQQKAFSRPYRFPKDGWGGRGQRIESAVQGNTMWTIRRDLREIVLQKIEFKPIESRPKLPLYKSVNISSKRLFNKLYQKPDFPEINNQKVFFGDLHHHSWYSDGTGDVDEFYTRCRNLLGDDFCALTDHDTFVGKPLQPFDWQYMKDAAGFYNAPGEFITFYGYEWTTARYPKGFGHKNVYSIDENLPLFDHTINGSRTTSELFEKLKAHHAIAVPHHIGWTGTDWENADEKTQPIVEIISNHGAFEYMGNKPIQHRGGIRGCFMQDGLARGLKFGIIGSSDSHGLIWHHHAGYKRNCYRSGLAAIIAPELTRESLFKALRRRHCYATSGIKLFLRFELEEWTHGDICKLDFLPRFQVECISPDDINYITLVRNNVDYYFYGGEGKHSRFTYKDTKPLPGEAFYYLRVITKSGEMAWSSPIWVTCEI